MANKCALINGVCPETADRTKGRFCPHWKDAIPEVVRDGSGRVVSEEIFRGCFLDRQHLYLLALARDSAHSAAAYNDARNEVAGALGAGEQPVARALVELGVLTLAGRRREERLESPASAAGALLDEGDGVDEDEILPEQAEALLARNDRG